MRRKRKRRMGKRKRKRRKRSRCVSITGFARSLSFFYLSPFLALSLCLSVVVYREGRPFGRLVSMRLLDRGRCCMILHEPLHYMIIGMPTCKSPKTIFFLLSLSPSLVSEHWSANLSSTARNRKSSPTEKYLVEWGDHQMHYGFRGTKKREV